MLVRGIPSPRGETASFADPRGLVVTRLSISLASLRAPWLRLNAPRAKTRLLASLAECTSIERRGQIGWRTAQVRPPDRPGDRLYGSSRRGRVLHRSWTRQEVQSR